MAMQGPKFPSKDCRPATKLQFDVVRPQGGCQLTHGRPEKKRLQDAQVAQGVGR